MPTDDTEETLRNRFPQTPDEYEVDQSLLVEPKDSQMQTEPKDTDVPSSRVTDQLTSGRTLRRCEVCAVLKETIKEKNIRLAAMFMLSCVLLFVNLFLLNSLTSQKKRAKRRRRMI